MLIKGVLDRIEGDYAIILLGQEEKKINWPRCFLPQGVREGQILCFTLKIDLDATKSGQDEVEELWQKILKPRP